MQRDEICFKKELGGRRKNCHLHRRLLFGSFASVSSRKRSFGVYINPENDRTPPQRGKDSFYVKLSLGLCFKINYKRDM